VVQFGIGVGCWDSAWLAASESTVIAASAAALEADGLRDSGEADPSGVFECWPGVRESKSKLNWGLIIPRRIRRTVSHPPVFLSSPNTLVPSFGLPAPLRGTSFRTHHRGVSFADVTELLGPPGTSPEPGPANTCLKNHIAGVELLELLSSSRVNRMDWRMFCST